MGRIYGFSTKPDGTLTVNEYEVIEGQLELFDHKDYPGGLPEYKDDVRARYSQAFRDHCAHSWPDELTPDTLCDLCGAKYGAWSE